MIHVCPLSRLNETLTASGASHMVTLLRADTAFERPASLPRERHLALFMHDIAEEQPEMTAPSRGHVVELIDFAGRWDQRAPLLIHCFAGISRSTAAAYIVAASLDPDRDEMELALTLRRLSPSATPNPRLIAMADAILGREGRMVCAIAAIGRGADAFEGTPFCLPLGSPVA